MDAVDAGFEAASAAGFGWVSDWGADAVGSVVAAAEEVGFAVPLEVAVGAYAGIVFEGAEFDEVVSFVAVGVVAGYEVTVFVGFDAAGLDAGSGEVACVAAAGEIAFEIEGFEGFAYVVTSSAAAETEVVVIGVTEFSDVVSEEIAPAASEFAVSVAFAGS